MQLEQMVCRVRLLFRLLPRSQPFAFATCIPFEYAVITAPSARNPSRWAVRSCCSVDTRAYIPPGVRSFSPHEPSERPPATPRRRCPHAGRPAKRRGVRSHSEYTESSQEIALAGRLTELRRGYRLVHLARQVASTTRNTWLKPQPSFDGQDPPASSITPLVACACQDARASCRCLNRSVGGEVRGWMHRSPCEWTVRIER